VSRGGQKLAHDTGSVRLDPAGATCLDVGRFNWRSFTDVHGATGRSQRVAAVEGRLWTVADAFAGIRGVPRSASERTYATWNSWPFETDLIVCEVRSSACGLRIRPRWRGPDGMGGGSCLVKAANPIRGRRAEVGKRRGAERRGRCAAVSYARLLRRLWPGEAKPRPPVGLGGLPGPKATGQSFPRLVTRVRPRAPRRHRRTGFEEAGSSELCGATPSSRRKPQNIGPCTGAPSRRGARRRSERSGASPPDEDWRNNGVG